MKTEEQLVDELSKMVNGLKTSYKLKRYLNEQNVAEERHEELIKQARAKYLAKTGKPRKIAWTIAAVVSFVAFWFLPTSIANMSPIVISAIGSLIVTIFVVQAIADFRDLDELTTKKESEQDWRHDNLWLGLIPLILFTVVFMMHFGSEKANVLQKEGEKAVGVVISKDYTSIRRNSKMYQATIEYKTKTGRKIRLTESITEKEYQSIYQGMEVPLIYYPDDPQVVELVIAESDIKKYTDSEERDIVLQDLVSIMQISDNDSITKMLNTVKYGWKYDETKNAWVNENISGVIVKAGSILKYMFKPENPASWQQEQEGFESVETENKRQKRWKSDDYVATIEMGSMAEVGLVVTITLVEKGLEEIIEE